MAFHSPRRTHQGVISGEFNFNGVEYVEIFDRDYKYMYGQIDDLFVAHGTWVEYLVVEAPQNHPKNCKYFAKNLQYVDVKKSKAPTSDEFRSNDMNVRDYNKVDFFQYDNAEGLLSHKSTIRRDPRRNNQYFNEYYGDVIITGDAHRRLLEHRIDELDVMMNLIPSRSYVSGPYWDVIHFINQGKCYSINGYLSITGHVLRGPGGVVRNRSEVTVAPDSLRPRNTAVGSFGNAPAGRRGLGGRQGFGLGATSAAGFGFGHEQRSPVNMSNFHNNNNDASIDFQKKKMNDNFGGGGCSDSSWNSTGISTASFQKKNQSMDPFQRVADDSTRQMERLKLDGKSGFSTIGDYRRQPDGRGFGKPTTGLGRLSNARF